MEKIASSALKTILLSKRANIYYLEKCRVMQKDGRIVYLTEGKKENLYWNIPIANTTTLLLGTGTSITQAAVRDLAGAGVMIGFCGGGGTPLLAGTEIAWLSPQSEYRPTQYVQDWLAFWYDDAKRLAAAKKFQEERYAFLGKVWGKDRDLAAYGFYSDDLEAIAPAFHSQIKESANVSQLLNIEARLTKALYKHAAQITGTENFTRCHEDGDRANRLLDHGNYLAWLRRYARENAARRAGFRRRRSRKGRHYSALRVHQCEGRKNGSGISRPLSREIRRLWRARFHVRYDQEGQRTGERGGMLT